MARFEFSNADLKRLFDFIDQCHTDIKTDNFIQVIDQKFNELLPHQMFVYGHVNFHTYLVNDRDGGTFPEEYIDLAKTQDGSIYCPGVRDWARCLRPVFYAEHTHRRKGTANKRMKTYLDYGIRNIAIHGMVETTKMTGICFGFANLYDQWDTRSSLILRTVIPHLYSMLTTQSVTECDLFYFKKPLTSREATVLHWISRGKTNEEIGMILNISICTVRIHVQNIIRKLNASNRTHAVAKAIKAGLIGL